MSVIGEQRSAMRSRLCLISVSVRKEALSHRLANGGRPIGEFPRSHLRGPSSAPRSA
jgi:hypothetical protein